jgi:hypothetical protein
MIGKEGRYTVYHRFREAHAIELQQGLFAHMGRVGLIAPMPGTFPVAVDIYICNSAGAGERLETPVLTRERAVCFAGKPDGHRLVLTEDSIDELLAVIGGLDETRVAQTARRALGWLKASDIALDLQRGLAVPASASGWQQIKSKVRDPQAETSADRIVGLVARNPEPLTIQCNQNSGILFVIRDLNTPAAQ